MPPVRIAQRAEVKPLATDRYQVRFTASGETKQKLQVAQDLLAPAGDFQFRRREHEATDSDDLQTLHRRQHGLALQRRTVDGVEEVERHHVHAQLSQRHGGGFNKKTLADVKGGAAVGCMDGHAKNLKYQKYYEMAGAPPNLPPGSTIKRIVPAPNDLYYDPRDRFGGAVHIPAIDGP